MNLHTPPHQYRRKHKEIPIIDDSKQTPEDEEERVGAGGGSRSAHFASQDGASNSQDGGWARSGTPFGAVNERILCIANAPNEEISHPAGYPPRPPARNDSQKRYK